ncbi:MAG: CHASE2 domain-containing protein [Mojavia pulchra JT2-VF2]|jgi:CHASE2 domain-containing sensor protein|uniref:CHASE2 domain-containing protein n=1 Tax=Mojavia pulchra JT2-VF2 TaxID=287848 RepID=A0A951PZ57_9NOST|nr:CHASE2 domain-containing protein [Mojavia pulchra JT2-VF2]
MAKLVVLKLDGNLSEHGCRVTLEIGAENARPKIEVSGNLPVSPELATYFNQWQDKYRSLGIPSRIKPQEIIYDGSIKSRIEKCSQSGKLLSDRLQTWLDSQEFRHINNTLREELNRDETIRVLIRTDNSQLQRLPWHLWDFFKRYSQAEFALSATVSETPPTPPHKPKVRILAILGNSAGINIQLDRQLLTNLPNAETVFLVEPQRDELNNYLWQQWDILFFAGHSETSNGTGRIYINKSDSLTIDELNNGLKSAISQGLQLAIFNSCDGLGLAWQLATLNIPQMIVMREPVPDEVAQEFLKHFLVAFSRGKSLYLASREAREKLQGLENKFPNATWLPVIFQNPGVLPPTWKQLCSPKIELKRIFLTVLLVSVLITTLVMGVRYLGMLQQSELQAYDHLMQMRSPLERSDPRLLIVTVGEADIHYQNQKRMNGIGSLSDQALAQLLQKLEQYQPTTIGIDIYRDFPVDPDYPDLTTRLQQDHRIFTVCKVSANLDGEPDGIHSPDEVPKERQSFSDFVIDNDEIPRRQLLHLTPPIESPCAAEDAFSLQLARHYLLSKNINADITTEGDLQIGNVVFKPLKEHSSGYQKIDASGYQVLLNYRSLRLGEKIAETVSLKDVLNDKINRELVESLKNRIVLIGVTAPSTKADYWKIPTKEKKIQGLLVQAHMVSQILSAVLDRRPLLWWWSGWIEAVWIWGWSLVGGIIAWRCLKPLYLGLAIATTLLTLFGICFGIFTQAGWIPLIPPVLALVLTAMVVMWMLRRENFVSQASRF